MATSSLALTLLRPGAVSGPYPERLACEDGPGVQLYRRLKSLLQSVRRSRDQSDFLRHVAQHEASLHAASDPELRHLTLELRHALGKDGLTAPLVAYAFALVREVAERSLGMRPYDVQLLGAREILSGRLAEMATGEGKTLVAALPAAAAALAGVPVHIITVNDYLAERDRERLAPLFDFLSLRTDVALQSKDMQQRRAAYACDITYVTGQQVAFDYLHDRLLSKGQRSSLRRRIDSLGSGTEGPTPPLLRGLCFAIIDEADSVLVDEARTPLILAREVESASLCATYAHALKLARELIPGQDFIHKPGARTIELTTSGREHAATLSTPDKGAWQTQRSRYTLVTQALSALHLYQRDVHYFVRDDSVQIIDEYTGRSLPDRSWSRGLHQLIETKERCTVSAARETLSQITYQRLFPRYLRVGAMTGTAVEVSAELRRIYDLQVSVLPTHRPSRRKIHAAKLVATQEAKWRAVAEHIRQKHAKGQPVLAGTRSVQDSERLSQVLQKHHLAHQVLNARQDQTEAEIVARAGQRGAITVATNMAGRGTDIKLDPQVHALGGLHVVSTELHDARRIDRQLVGRCARQGDPGSCQLIVSLEDEIFVRFCPAPLAQLARATLRLNSWIPLTLYRFAQRLAEHHTATLRRRMMQQDKNLEAALGFAGDTE